MKSAILIAPIIALASCSDTFPSYTHHPTTTLTKTSIPSVIAAAHTASPLDHFDALIDLFCFRRINRNVFINNTQNHQDIDAFERVFREFQAQGPLDDFEEKYGRRLAVYIASHLLSFMEDQLPPHLLLFIDLITTQPTIGGAAHVSLTRSYLKLDEHPTMDVQLEKVLVHFMARVGEEEGRDMRKFMVALFGESDDEGWDIGDTTKLFWFPVNSQFIRLFCKCLFEGSALSESVFQNIMKDLDTLTSKIHIQLLVKEKSEPAFPRDFDDFASWASKIDNDICWHTISRVVLNHAINGVDENVGVLSGTEVSKRLVAAMDKAHEWRQNHFVIS